MSQATPSTLWLLNKSSIWSQPTWKSLEAAVCKGMGYNQMEFKYLKQKVLVL